MEDLAKFKHLPIDWDVEPADAVALHLEWGNTGYSGKHIDSDSETYFFCVDSWEEPYVLRLQKMTKDGSETMFQTELPREFWDCCKAKGVHGIPPEVKEWLQKWF